MDSGNLVIVCGIGSGQQTLPAALNWDGIQQSGPNITLPKLLKSSCFR